MVRLAIARRWTPEDDALLVQLLEEGEAWPVIAARLKRTMAAVQHRAASRLRVPHRSDEALSAMPRRPISRRWTPADDELLVKLLREDKSFVIVARRMKRTP